MPKLLYMQSSGDQQFQIRGNILHLCVSNIWKPMSIYEVFPKGEPASIKITPAVLIVQEYSNVTGNTTLQLTKC